MRLSAEFPTVWFENVGHPNQLGIGSRAHLVHCRSAMNFDGDFADPEIAGDLLIHFAGRDVQHRLLLAPNLPHGLFRQRDAKGSPFSLLLSKMCSFAKRPATYKGRSGGRANLEAGT